MIIETFPQYSDEWWDARLSIPTASIFKDIVTSTGKKASSFLTTACKLAAERERKKRDETFESKWMKRGTELEPEARSAYELITGHEVKEVGLIFQNEQRLWSCSPDGITIKGGLEIKALSPGVHIQYRHEKKVPTKHRPQVYGSLWIADELEYWDFFSYHPDMRPFLLRTTREDMDFKKYVFALESYMPLFVETVKEIANGT